MKNFLIVFLTFYFFPAVAHPSWGIVVDGKGNIIFSDLVHIWQITPGGKLEKRIANHHTHELYLDQKGFLWGTDSDYTEATDLWRNRLWKQSPDGQLSDAIPWVEGFEQFGGSNFVVDEMGDVYFPFQNQLYKRTSGGEVSLRSDFTFGRLCTIAADGKGNILVSDSHEDGSLYRVGKEGAVELIAGNLKEQNPKNPPLEEKRFNLFYGITRNETDVYLANSGSRRILSVKPDGSFSEYFTSEPPWYPAGIYFDQDQVLILEWGFTKTNIGPRILKKNEEGNFDEIYNHETKVVRFSRLESPIKNNHWWYWIGGALLLILLFFVKSRRFT